MPTLEQPRLKVKRAKQHLRSLEMALKRFRDSKPYGARWRLEYEADGTYCIVEAQVHRAIPNSIPFLIGDVCNNLRSALDQLFWQMCLKRKPSFSRHDVYFPIFDDSSTFHGRRSYHVRHIVPAQRTVVERLQPYHTGNEALSILRELNNADKHRGILVVSAVTDFQVGAVYGMNLLLDPGESFTMETASNMRLEDGAQLMRLPVGDVTSEETMDVQTRFRAYFAFGDEPSIASGKEILKTLQNIASEVERCIATIALMM